MSLYLILLFPFLSIALLFALRSSQAVKWVSFIGSFVQLVLLIAFYFHFKSLEPSAASNPFKYQEQITWFPSVDIHFHIGIDGIALSLMLLTAVVMMGAVLVSWKIETLVKEYFILLFLLSMGAYGTFMSLNLIVLFFFLELAVIPKFLLISIWGSGNRKYSANKLAIMLIGASAFIFTGIVSLYFMLPEGERSFDIVKLSLSTIDSNIQSLVYVLIFIGFGTFSAVVPFHNWVPDGHSSAPTAGSMLLAGISMKLGGFGLLRIATYLFPLAAIQYAEIVIVVGTISILYGAVVTMMQKDLKYLNAYSSISHCGFIILGMGMLTQTALNGAVIQLISHGIMTALFFAIIGMIYERTHTRTIGDMSGLLTTIPFISTILIIVGLCSLGLPGMSGFVSEMLVLMGSFEKPTLFHRAAAILSAMSIVITAVYILRAVTKVTMGETQVSHAGYHDASWNEKLAALLLVAAIFIIGLYPQWLIDLVSNDTKLIIDKILLSK